LVHVDLTVLFLHKALDAFELVLQLPNWVVKRLGRVDLVLMVSCLVGLGVGAAHRGGFLNLISVAVPEKVCGNGTALHLCLLGRTQSIKL
jgi:hypothetical protein